MEMGGSYCDVKPVDEIEEQDQLSDRRRFKLCFKAKLFFPVFEETEDFLFDPDNMVCSADVAIDMLMDYDVLLDADMSKPAITHMLSQIGVVPVPDWMVQRILDSALSMTADKRYMDRRVFRMNVCIDAFVNELPSQQLFDDYDDDAEEDMADEFDDWEPRFEPTCRVSIEKLDRVKIEERGGRCCVCLDDFEIGLQATRMPCLHLFHGDCIVKWLKTSKFCPLCRFQMPS